MSRLDALDNVAEVQKAIETDLMGRPLDFKGDIDADPIGALMAYVHANLDQVGVNLGLGNVKSIQLSGPDFNTVSYQAGESLIDVFLGPQQSAAQVGLKIRDAIGGT